MGIPEAAHVPGIVLRPAAGRNRATCHKDDCAHGYDALPAMSKLLARNDDDGDAARDDHDDAEDDEA